MVARAPSPLIALAAGLLAVSLGFTPAESAAAPPSTGNSISAWFNHTGSANSPPPVTPVADTDDDGPIDKLSAGLTNMGKSVKKVFTRSSQNTTTAHPKPKTEDDALSLNKPARPGADFYISLAHFQEHAGNEPGAIEQYKRALEVEPTSLPALLALGRAYDRQGQLSEAMKYYQQATANHPNQPAAHNDQGLCYARQEKYSEAIVCLQKAVELQPDRVLYRNNLATVQVELGQIDRAVETLSAVHGKAVAYYNVGFLLNKRNRTAEALRQFKLAAASDPKFDAARQWVDTLSAKLASEPEEKPPAKPADSPPSPSAVATIDHPPAKTASAPASHSATATFLGLGAKPANPPPTRSAVAEFFNPTPKPANPPPPQSAVATFFKPTPKPADPAPSPSATAAGDPADEVPAAPAPGKKTVAVAPESSLVVKDTPSASVEPPAVTPAPTAALPGAILQRPPQRGPGVVRSRSDDDGDKPKPRSNDARRSQPTVLLTQRPTRLPPTPDQIQDYSRGASAVDASNLIVPLPPVDPEHYPASRY